MILVDSSVWIDFFSSSPGPAGHQLRRMLVGGEAMAITGIVLCEVLQGLTREFEKIARYLSLCDLLEPRGLETYRMAAAIFRQGRARGVALTTTDVLIAALAIENQVPVFTLDKDFAAIARFTALRLHHT